MLIHGTKSVRINETNKTCSNAVYYSLVTTAFSFSNDSLSLRKKKKKEGGRKVCLESANEISPLFPPPEQGEKNC